MDIWTETTKMGEALAARTGRPDKANVYAREFRILYCGGMPTDPDVLAFMDEVRAKHAETEQEA